MLHTNPKLDQLTAELADLTHKRHMRHKIENDLRMVLDDLKQAETKFAALEVQLEKEQVDVDKLTSTSLSSVFYSVLGQREDRLEKERQELFAVQVKYRDKSAQITSLQGQVGDLNRRLSLYDGVNERYSILLDEKEAQLTAAADSELITQLLAFTENEAIYSAELDEIREALSAGELALTGLNQAVTSLESAENWGTWDMLGGGILADIQKHTHIEEANAGLRFAQEHVGKFKRELVDVKMDVDVTIEITNIEYMADFFLDGFFSDWHIQSKIQEAVTRVKATRMHVRTAMTDLRQLQNKISDLREKLRSDRDDFIAHA